MSDEWRVEVDLDDEQHGLKLGERLRSLDLDDEARKRLGDRVIVTRDGSKLFLYATTEEQAREAEGVARDLVAAEGLSADTALTRWHPDADEWKDASVPMPQTDAERAAERERHEEAAEREPPGALGLPVGGARRPADRARHARVRIPARRRGHRRQAPLEVPPGRAPQARSAPTSSPSGSRARRPRDRRSRSGRRARRIRSSCTSSRTQPGIARDLGR